MVPGFLDILKSRSALAELRCAAGSLEAVLLPFLHARIAREETGLLESATEFGIGNDQRVLN